MQRIEKPVHVLIVGGGIAGLTLANLLVHGNKKNKFHVTIFESRAWSNSQRESVGGGIGLWPPSQAVLKNIPNYQAFIQQASSLMPSLSYRDSHGKILARAHDDFGDRFPIQCLNRDDLLDFLLTGLKNRDDVEMISSQEISEYKRDHDKIVINVAGDKSYQGDLLIASDGIHSKIRNCLMSELKQPPIHEIDLGYTYFRANVEIPVSSPKKWWSHSFETWGNSASKKYGNHEVRFGYVPLKPPHVFWFIAIKTQNNHKYLSPMKSVKIVDEDTKAFLQDLVQTWTPIRNDAGDVIVDYAELINLTHKILRTDIAKIKGVEKFPWTSTDGRVVLLGDSVHATAPNIAQGAGLCIEDAACLTAKLDRVDYLQGVAEYERERKPRAQTVQNIADAIASVGQVANPWIKMLRDKMMRVSYRYFPSWQQSIFENVVSHSLGGGTKSPYWQVPSLSTKDDTQSSLFSRVFITTDLLDKEIKDFKTSSTGGEGFGVVTVEKPSSLAKILGTLAGFPHEMKQQPFYAEVINVSKDVQRWNRVFGYKTPQQKTYATTHSTYCGINRQTYLSEGIGGFLDKSLRFIYSIKREPDHSLRYESQGMTLFDAFKLPLPAFLLPKSEWIEKPTETGWKFDGKVSLPILGTLMHYYGDFKVNKIDGIKNKKMIIAGGSGMIGKEVCLEFIKKGYDVYCLSRSAKTEIGIEGVKVRRIDQDWSDLIDKNTMILNLGGENPGAKRWSPAVKAEIAESRFRVIDTILNNIEKASEKPLKFLQASAAGFYGDAGDAILTEESKPVVGDNPGTKFRVELCEEIEKRAKKANCNVVNLRIGHVLANSGGLLPYCRYAGIFGAGRFGSGKQFVPFVHIRDVARAIEFIASHNFTEGALNITAPEPCRNSDMLKELRLVKGGLVGIPVPESILKLLIGESSVVLTDSERIQPKRLLESGFEFNYNTINESLRGLK